MLNSKSPEGMNNSPNNGKNLKYIQFRYGINL